MKKIMSSMVILFFTLSVYADEFWTSFKTSDVFKYPYEITINSIVISPNNEKYFICQDRFFYIYNEKEWLKIEFYDYPKHALYSLAFDDTTMWIGGESYVFHFDGQEILDAISVYNLFPELQIAGPIISVEVDDYNIVWMLYENNYDWRSGLFSFDGDRLEMHGDFSFAFSFYDMAIDKNNHIWVTSNKGVFFYDRKTWHLFRDERHTIYDDLGRDYNICGTIAVDHDDVVWVGLGIWGGSAHGLVSYDGKTWKWYNAESSGLVDDRVSCIAVDQNNVKWIGTYYDGVSRFDGETWTTFTSQNSGLPNSKWLNSIAVEKNNTIWFGMHEVIAKYTGEVIATAVDDNTTPEPIPLIRSFPNPFNPTTIIEFTLPDAGLATLTIYNMAGQKVRELASERMAAGTHRLQWDGKDNSGISVSAGVYIARLKAGEITATGKLVLVK